MPAADDGSMRRDILSAYAASASRILGWVIVSALVYRRSTEAFAMLALVRGTLGILNYCSLGLLPAMIQAFASIPSPPASPGGEGEGEGGATDTVSPIATPVSTAEGNGPTVLPYVMPQTTRAQQDAKCGTHAPTQRIYSVGITIAISTMLFGLIATSAIVAMSSRLYRIPEALDRSDDVMILVLGLGTGIALRWFSEPPAGVLQAFGAITVDNALLVGSELSWALLTWILERQPVFSGQVLRPVALAYAISGALLVLSRAYAAHARTRVRLRLGFDLTILNPLLSTGLLITLAQLADYLYAPTDYILINRLLTARDLANYAPALQIDAGLMILVGGLASVLLPKAALAHGAGDRAAVRAYYLRGTLASAALLAAASVVVYFLSPWIFRLWLGDPMPGTRAILPLVLFHTTLGGSALIGRSILLAIGRTKPFTISVLIAGVTNVVASYAFVHYFGWGLKGIVLGTIVAVVARCSLWMPWYVLRHVGEAHADVAPAVDQ